MFERNQKRSDILNMLTSCKSDIAKFEKKQAEII